MSTDRDDSRQARKVALAIAFLCVLLVIAGLLLFGELASLMTLGSQGMGWRTGAIVSFFLTTGLLVLFAITGGDGLFGEIQYMIGAFMGFFVVFWMLLVFIF